MTEIDSLCFSWWLRPKLEISRLQPSAIIPYWRPVNAQDEQAAWSLLTALQPDLYLLVLRRLHIHFYKSCKVCRHLWKSSEKFPSISYGLPIQTLVLFQTISSPITVLSSHSLQVDNCYSANIGFPSVFIPFPGRVTTSYSPIPPDQHTGWVFILIWSGVSRDVREV